MARATHHFTAYLLHKCVCNSYRVRCGSITRAHGNPPVSKTGHDGDNPSQPYSGVRCDNRPHGRAWQPRFKCANQLLRPRTGRVNHRRWNGFLNFLISSTDTRHIRLTGLEQGWKVDLYLGIILIGSATADANRIAMLPVTSALIAVNARIIIKDEQGNLIIERSFIAVVGGNEYVYGA